MGEDEAGTLAALKAHRKDLLLPKEAQYHGRTIKLMGDGALMEFASVVDAVSFAVEVQCAMRIRNAQVPEDKRITYRMGINIGDVIVDGDDIYGDGVNVAARLESLAEPGGICVSRTVFDHVKGKLDVTFDHLGEKEVKNIAQPVTVYRLDFDDKATALATPVIQASIGKSRRGWAVVAAAFTMVLLGGLGLIWWLPWTPQEEPASIERMALPLPDKPSIAVLPFDNLSDNPEQGYFADGLTDDLITELSKIPDLFVIARNSTFVYKGKPTKVQQVAEDLGVHYVLEGSVRRSGDQLRINAQLIDALSGHHIWAERYDATLDDVFALQDKVTRNIVAALALNLTPEEMAQQGRSETGSAEAYDAFLRGWAHYRRSTPDDFTKAVPYFEKAIALDPNYSRAYAALAALYSAVADKNWSTGTSVWSLTLGITMEEGLRREQVNLQQAMKNPTLLAHLVASRRFTRQGQHAAAIDEAKRAVESEPSDPLAHEALGNALVYAGRPSDAVSHLRQAMRLDPQFSQDYLFLLGLAQFGMEQYAEAAKTLTNAAQSRPDDDRSLIVLAASNGHLGNIEEAKGAIEEANKIRGDRQKGLPESGVEVGIDVLLIGPYTLKDVDFWPFKEKADRERLREGLRLAEVLEAGKGEQVSPLEVPGATTVDPATAKKLFDRGATFVDVRPQTLWGNGHIPGAVHLDLKTMLTEASLSDAVAKDQEVVFYCMGPRCLVSSTACSKAVAWGFQKVYYLRQGYPGWKAAGFPVVVP